MNSPVPRDRVAADFSDLSLAQLLSLSVSGDDEPEDEEGDEDSHGGETASDESDGDGEGEEEDAAPDDSPRLFQELQVETVEWLSQDDELSLLASGHGFFDQGVATAGSLELRSSLGDGTEVTLRFPAERVQPQPESERSVSKPALSA